MTPDAPTLSEVCRRLDDVARRMDDVMKRIEEDRDRQEASFVRKDVYHEALKRHDEERRADRAEVDAIQRKLDANDAWKRSVAASLAAGVIMLLITTFFTISGFIGGK